ncbi:purine/pyrimidine permease [Desulfosporosinus fructosivorans]
MKQLELEKCKTDNSSQLPMRYGLDDSLPTGELISYAMQHLTYFIANAAIMPVVIGGDLGLDQLALASLLQRTFILCGVVSILQVVWGHRFPIFEGPAGMWYGVFMTLATSAPALGKSLALLRTDIEMGLIIAGLCCIILGVTGSVGRITKIFSPMVNGTFLLLMSLQLSPSILNGLLGLSGTNNVINLSAFLASLVTIALMMWISLKAKGFLQSVAILIGAVVGWILAAVLNIAPPVNSYGGKLPLIPSLFAWGTPTFDMGVTLTCIIAALILFSNLVASIVGLSNLTGEPLTAKMFNRGAIFNGVSDIIAGIGAVFGFIPYGSAMGFTAMTRVASRKPFILGNIFLIVLGAIPLVGAFLASIPPTVGYSVMFVVFGLILGMGLQEFTKIKLSSREMFIIGSSLLIGIGVMFLPAEAFNGLPSTFRYLMRNGLVDGVIICILLEQVFLKR